MALSVVKKQLNHLAWWKTHEVQFSHVGFVAQQILGIVGSQIEAKRVFSIAGICTNLQHFWLGIENLDMLINIYKN